MGADMQWITNFVKKSGCVMNVLFSHVWILKKESKIKRQGAGAVDQSSGCYFKKEHALCSELGVWLH